MESEDLEIGDLECRSCSADGALVKLDPTCVDSIVQQLTTKLDSMLSMAAQTTFEHILLEQFTSALDKMRESQQGFLQALGESIHKTLDSRQLPAVAQQDCSVLPLSPPRGRLSRAVTSELAGGGKKTTFAAKLPGKRKGRLTLHQMDQLLTKDILRQHQVSSMKEVMASKKSTKANAEASSPSMLSESSQPSNDEADLPQEKSNSSFPPRILEDSEDEDLDDEIVSVCGLPQNLSDEAEPEPKKDKSIEKILPGVPLDDQDLSGRRSRRLSSLRQKAVTKLVAPSKTLEITDDANMKAESFLCRVWAFWGIIPWCPDRYAKWYRCFVIMLSVSSTSWPSYKLAQNSTNPSADSVLILLSICTLASLIFLTPVQDLIGPCSTTLLHHATSHGFLKDWVDEGLKNLKLFTCVWVCAGLAGITLSVTLDGIDIVTLALTVYQLGLFLAVIHCLTQLLVFLDNMVDQYCMLCFQGVRCDRAVYVWNLLQALLRHVAKSMENCLVCLQVSIMFAFLWLLSRFVDALTKLSSESLMQQFAMMKHQGILSSTIFALISLLVMVPSSLVIFVKAASVSEECSRVPALINSLVTQPEKKMNLERQYIVTFIVNSDAGFYVKGVRLTAAIVMKMSYLFGAIVCTLGTTAVKLVF